MYVSQHGYGYDNLGGDMAFHCGFFVCSLYSRRQRSPMVIGQKILLESRKRKHSPRIGKSIRGLCSYFAKNLLLKQIFYEHNAEKIKNVLLTM